MTGRVISGVEDVTLVDAGQPLTLEVSVAEGSSETYLVYDQQQRATTTHTEALRVEWFTSHGVVGHHERVIDEGRRAHATLVVDGLTNLRWWVVVRDARGGTASRTGEIQNSAAE